MNQKKRYVAIILSFTLLILVIGALWPPLSSIISVRTVQGEKFYSPRVSSEEAWFAGYSIFVLRPPIFHVLSNESIKWQKCKKLSDGLLRIFQNYRDIFSEVNLPFEYIAETSGYGYSAYIRTNEVIIFIDLYPDKNGDVPDLKEYGVCDTK